MPAAPVEPKKEATVLTVKEMLERGCIGTLLEATLQAAVKLTTGKVPNWTEESKRRALGIKNIVCGSEPEAPVSPPSMKLAQRLAAFVEERAALRNSVNAWDATVPATQWAGHAFIAACAGQRSVGTNSTHDDWEEGSAVRLKYEAAGFKVHQYSAFDTPSKTAAFRMLEF